MERKILEPLREKASCIIDTTNMKPKDLKEGNWKNILYR